MPLVAIDGPAGSGKSTVARAVADRLGAAYLDTGAMYRSVALAALQRGVDASDGEALATLARSLDIEVGARVLVDGVDATTAIRRTDVTAVVSAISAHPPVRAEMVRRQRRW
ncbi:MAG: (d)CMP kinase, partial [Acidimicrobiia bacterium]|nr:(d)CMP kinase [Acidimicrobiia bacterium]